MDTENIETAVCNVDLPSAISEKAYNLRQAYRNGEGGEHLIKRAEILEKLESYTNTMCLHIK